MKSKDLSEQSFSELIKKKSTISKNLFEAKMKNSLGQLSNPIEIRDLRKDLARVKTLITKKLNQK